MAEWDAPAKVNLDLRVGEIRSDGLHPIRSVIQTVEWCDHLVVEEADEDLLAVEGADLPVDGENLVWRAVEALGANRPRGLGVHLDKRVAVAAGLGGGSSDAAAMLVAVTDMIGVPRRVAEEVAPRVGSDVPYFLVGGTARVEGAGEHLIGLDALDSCAVGVVVPPFELSTADVYRRWDELDGPVGETTDRFALAPPLRALDDVRNDLTPAAVSLRPELDDWMRELSREWSRPVLMSGSGPACFGVFVDVDEAGDAVGSVGEHRAAFAAPLRHRGVGRREE